MGLWLFYGAGRVLSRIRNYTSTIGYGGRLEQVNSTVTPRDLGTGTGTNSSSRSLARRLGNTLDDAGHALSRMLGGGGGVSSNNIFPQSPNINRGVYREFERQIVQSIKESGETAQIQIILEYSSNTSTRPSLIRYFVKIGDEIQSRIFINP